MTRRAEPSCAWYRAKAGEYTEQLRALKTATADILHPELLGSAIEKAVKLQIARRKVLLDWRSATSGTGVSFDEFDLDQLGG